MLRLDPMTPLEYERYLAYAVEDYAQAHFRNGDCDPVGLLWLALMEREGRPFIYIYDIEIVEARRSQGLGSALLGLAEDYARGIGVSRVSLNVMGWNTRARSLYERHGFGVTGIGMSKRLDVKPS
ncbi:GNAT family N-acetyltransferase [Usitatibacter palustris]|uniref:Putative N-acetyltransferase YycN n=1 Tax=Usitatibacter palustris TaxID=2732487 RepID=A0A6M4HAF2_9PROT|nr:GNAT family N-acetyltransferase [Usitatibacter palustris]QJR15828.1 putative N-acetyltransferase YycN [Usitatibacter palustris]